MTIENILISIGQFSPFEVGLFEANTTRKSFAKNAVLLNEGETCRSLYFILSGSFFQYQLKDINDIIIDLHLQDEWMFNNQSLIEQKPSTTTIKAFVKSEVLEMSLKSFHFLSSTSPSFLQFAKILNQAQNRVYIFDNLLTPSEKYEYIQTAKPALAKVFPIKMIASYLKIAPETLSRVRAQC
jgi:CRP-like cAMP-binding protein